MVFTLHDLAIMKLLLLGLLVGCGSTNPLDPGGGDSTGTGTSTLVVNGVVTAQPRVPAAKEPTDFDTNFTVRITANNLPVTTGTVSLTSTAGVVELTFQPGGNTINDAWVGTASGYEEVYQLDVVSGADNVKGVRVDGPDIHTFTDPLAGATVDSTLALPIAWARGSVADVATVRVGDGGGNGGGGGGGAITITDTGTYSLAPASLHAQKDKAQPNTIHLRRTNRVTPTGAAGGSELDVSIDNTIDVVAQPDPNA